MKQTMLTLVLIITAAASFSQITPTDIKTKAYYLTKSRHQKTIGWIMLGGGVALTGVGIGVAQAETTDYALGNSNSGNAGSVLAIAGIASALGSIPLFVSAAHNKHKAAALAFDMQKVPLLFTMNNITATFQPTVMLKIPL